jgi:hypothetical protein
LLVLVNWRARTIMIQNARLAGELHDMYVHVVTRYHSLQTSKATSEMIIQESTVNSINIIIYLVEKNEYMCGFCLESHVNADSGMSRSRVLRTKTNIHLVASK